MPKGKKYGGRVKGTPNRKTFEFIKTLQSEGFDPALELVNIFRETMKLYEAQKVNSRRRYRNYDAAERNLSLAERTANDIAQYVYPKRRAVEHTGEMNVKTLADFIAMAEGGKIDDNLDDES